MRWRTGLSSIMSGAMRSKEPAILTNRSAAADPIAPASAARHVEPPAQGVYLPTENRGGPGRQPESE